MNNIKQKAAVIALNKELKAVKRESSFSNFETAQTVGFIFNAGEREKYVTSKEFIEFVEKKNIRIFGVGYTSKSDQIAYFPYMNGVSYFGLDEVNWYGKPTNNAISDFLKRKYDILIDLSQSELFQIHYIFALSNAKFKITNSGVKSKYADFVLQLDNTEKLGTYISQIKHYLEAIQIK
jgi:hypothetical protein